MEFNSVGSDSCVSELSDGDISEVAVVYNDNRKSKALNKNDCVKIRHELEEGSKIYNLTMENRWVTVSEVVMYPNFTCDEEIVSKCAQRIRTPGHGEHMERFLGVFHDNILYLVIGCETVTAILQWIGNTPNAADREEYLANDLNVAVATFENNQLSLTDKAEYVKFVEDRRDMFQAMRKETEMMTSCRSVMKLIAGKNFSQVWRLPRGTLCELFCFASECDTVKDRFVNLIIASVLPDDVYSALFDIANAIETGHQRLKFKSFKLFNRDVPRMIKTALIDGRISATEIVARLRSMLAESRIAGKDVDSLKLVLRSEKMDSSAARTYHRRIEIMSSSSSSSVTSETHDNDEIGDAGDVVGDIREGMESPQKKMRFGILRAFDEQSSDATERHVDPKEFYMALLRSSTVESARFMMRDDPVKCAAWIRPPLQFLGSILAENPSAQLASIVENDNGQIVTSLVVLFKISLPDEIANRRDMQFPSFPSIRAFYDCIHSVTDLPVRMYFSGEEIPRGS